ncbi:filamentous hemagglutinin N-terminal domain-containing protein [Tolypothrix sp. FACHB-123]|uniref:two-partner secretion domain-containing protein n=1 Tax=Tolypothrix sp. FACHB-123 TaxID=2692868 RepID=UPI00168330E0|nr:filamentous hemagglutinin N-terminal domain-containing protein [Tolypothrix sp. FACHB-123]MBD2353058.1 filamentous hemagglutinin N-terminal domain-containing protein [Tolypothrix sp. FACHB-123]
MVHYKLIKILVSSGAIACTLSLTPGVWAQIIPDNSLGTESSVITPNVQQSGGNIERIDGGAIRGSNLFHSFQDFNVGNQQRVYFANPSGIENILGRVTGNQASTIFGTLGVLGGANLYLINPNGIVFGKDARLDISGSFFASTSKSLLFPNGERFGTQNPKAPSLLTINQPLGLDSWLPPESTITNSGNLSVGQDLTLAGKNLDLQGQLQAGNNLTLQATDTLKIRDSVNQPFIASSGQKLLAQANKIDIFALNHPHSGFFAGNNMLLRSANAIGGNAKFSTGGNFRLEQINGNGGDLASTDDPIIRASGDVSFNSYTGASLHIFAGGSVTIDSLNITSPDNTNFINETVTLADGVTQVSINGSLKPTVDIRAGTTAFNPIGITGDSAVFSPPTSTDGNPSNANITINQIINQGGLIYLTNQYQPNPNLSGDINIKSLAQTFTDAGGGDIVIDSKGKIITPLVLGASAYEDSNTVFNNPGGNITLLAQSNIFMPAGAQIFSYGSVGGNITLKSQSAIIQEAAPQFSSFIETAAFSAGKGGDVTLNAPLISLSNFVQSNLRRSATGTGGNIIITAKSLEANQANLSTVTRAGNAGNVIVNAETISLNNSVIATQTRSAVGGNAGDVEINSKTFVATNGGQVFSQTRGLGNAGNVTVNVADAIALTGTLDGVFSGFSSVVRDTGQGNGGMIKIKTGSLSLQQGAQIRASTEGIGNAGKIEIESAKSVIIDGAVLFSPPGFPEPVVLPSAILSEVLPGSRGNANNIAIKTGQLTVKNGAFISSSTNSVGNAGNIFINASESVSFDGNPGEPFDPSGAFVGTLEGATGEAGKLEITTPSLFVTNGAQLEALTASAGKAGDIIIIAKDRVLLSGANTGLFSNTTPGSTGNSGSIFIDPELVEIKDGAAISVNSQGTGTGGDIEIQANKLILDNQALISAATDSTNGGNISLRLPDLLLLRRESEISTTAGNAGAGGDGGNITIDTNFIVTVPAEDSDITANAFFGRGGNVKITATSLFGTGFQAQPTSRSDITASSVFGVSGTVSINNPEIDPSSGLVELADKPTDPSDRIVASCAATEGNSFTITGTGGLPADPATTARGLTFLSDMRDFTTTESRNQATNTLPQIRQLIIAANSWRINVQGEVELVASLPQESFNKSPDCSNLSKLHNKPKNLKNPY